VVVENGDDLRQGRLGVDPVKRLREHHEVEPSACRLPVLEGCLLHRYPLGGRQLRHPDVGFDGQHLRTGRSQLRRRDSGARPDVEHTQSLARHQVVDHRSRVARPIPVVLLGGRAERLGPVAVGVKGHAASMLRRRA
jgi:hypothetical protein